MEKAAQLPDRWAHKDLKAHESRDGIPRQANDTNPLIFPESDRFPGPHVDAPKVHFPTSFDHSLDEIERAHTNSGRGKDQIRPQVDSPFKQEPDRFIIILCHTEAQRLCERLLAQGAEPRPMTQREFTAHLRTETDKYARLAREMGVRPE